MTERKYGLVERLLRGFIARKFGPELAYPELAGAAIYAAIREYDAQNTTSTREAKA